MTSTAAVAQLPQGSSGRVSMPDRVLPQDYVPVELKHTSPAWSPVITAQSTPAYVVEKFEVSEVSSQTAGSRSRGSQLDGNVSTGNVSPVEEGMRTPRDGEISEASDPRVEILSPHFRPGSLRSITSPEARRGPCASLSWGSDKVEPTSIAPAPSRARRVSRTRSADTGSMTKRFQELLHSLATRQSEDPAGRVGPKKHRLERRGSDEHGHRSARDSAFCCSGTPTDRRASYAGARGSWDVFPRSQDEEFEHVLRNPLAASQTDLTTIVRMLRTLEGGKKKREEEAREDQLEGARSTWDLNPGRQEEFAQVKRDPAAAVPRSNLTAAESIRRALEERADDEHEDEEEVKEEGGACPTYSEAVAFSEAVSAPAAVVPSNTALTTADVDHLTKEAALQGLVLPCGPSDDEKVLYHTTGRWMMVTFGMVGFSAIFCGMLLFTLSSPHFYWYGLPTLYIFVAMCCHYFGVSVWGKEFDPEEHEDIVRRGGVAEGHAPTVDVFLPVCNESTVLLANTWKHVQDLDYPHVIVYVLDDGASDEVEALAAAYGFEYIRRDNRPQLKKAGNLRNAFAQTSGEVITIFDADFCPRADFLRETLPYFVDPEIGILQTPQFFRRREEQTWVEQGAGASQEGFYRMIQVSKHGPLQRGSLRGLLRCVPSSGSRTLRWGSAYRALRGHVHRIQDDRARIQDKVPPVVPGDGSLSRRAAEFLPAAVPLVHGHHDTRNTRGVLEIRYFQDTQAVLRERHVLLLPDVLVRIFRALAGFAADLDQARGSSLVLLRLCGSGRVFHLRGRTRMVEAGFDHADVVVATRQDTAELRPLVRGEGPPHGNGCCLGAVRGRGLQVSFVCVRVFYAGLGDLERRLYRAHRWRVHMEDDGISVVPLRYPDYHGSGLMRHKPQHVVALGWHRCVQCPHVGHNPM